MFIALRLGANSVFIYVFLWLTKWLKNTGEKEENWTASRYFFIIRIALHVRNIFMGLKSLLILYIIIYFHIVLYLLKLSFYPDCFYLHVSKISILHQQPIVISPTTPLNRL